MMADRLPHACARERAHVLVHRPPGREGRGWRQVAPLAAGSHEVEQAVHQPPHVGRARPAAGLGGRDQGREQGVLLVAERLPRAKVADKDPALRCPHSVPPRRATPFPKPPARPLRLVIPLHRAGFSNGLSISTRNQDWWKRLRCRCARKRVRVAAPAGGWCRMILQILALSLFTTVMAVAAFEDFRRLTIPNLLPLALCAGWPFYVAAVPVPGGTVCAALGALGVALAVFL